MASNVEIAARSNPHTRGPWRREFIENALDYAMSYQGWVDDGPHPADRFEYGEAGEVKQAAMESATYQVATAAPEMFEALTNLLATQLTEQQRFIAEAAILAAIQPSQQ